MKSYSDLFLQSEFWTVIQERIVLSDDNDDEPRKCRHVKFRDYTNVRSAIRYGYANLLIQSDKKRFCVGYEEVTIALKKGNIDIVKWILDNNSTVIYRDLACTTITACHGHLDCFKYFYDKGIHNNNTVMEKAIVRLYTPIARWLHSNNLFVTSHQIVTWISEKVKRPDIYVCDKKDYHRHRDMLEWIWETYPDALTFVTSIYLTRCK